MNYFEIRNENSSKVLKTITKLCPHKREDPSVPWGAFACMVDRSGLLDTSMKVLSPLPPMTSKELVYSDIVNKRACDILENSNDNNIELRVTWSGGIDSTLVLSSLLNNLDKYPNADLSVCLSHRSIKEYPKFYNDHIKDSLKVYNSNDFGLDCADSFRKNVMRKSDKVFLVVTGEVNDCSAFGYNKDQDVSLLFKDYNEVLDSELIEAVGPLISIMPPHWDRNAINVVNWLMFNLTYQYHQLRMTIMNKIPYGNLLHFFDTVEMQQYYMSDSPVYSNNKKDFKNHLKSYILDFNGDKDYYDNKIKEHSLPIMNGATSNKEESFITELNGDFETVTSVGYMSGDEESEGSSDGAILVSFNNIKIDNSI